MLQQLKFEHVVIFTSSNEAPDETDVQMKKGCLHPREHCPGFSLQERNVLRLTKRNCKKDKKLQVGVLFLQHKTTKMKGIFVWSFIWRFLDIFFHAGCLLIAGGNCSQTAAAIRQQGDDSSAWWKIRSVWRKYSADGLVKLVCRWPDQFTYIMASHPKEIFQIDSLKLTSQLVNKSCG